MFIQVTGAKYGGEYKIRLPFNDGTKEEIDLTPELYGQVFDPLKKKAFFQPFV